MNFSPRSSSNFNSTLHNPQEIERAFNTALVKTRTAPLANAGKEIAALVTTPEFQTLLEAAQTLAEREGISAELACVRLIETFRKLDAAWDRYVFEQGVGVVVTS